jgi:hypothetical protein
MSGIGSANTQDVIRQLQALVHHVPHRMSDMMRYRVKEYSGQNNVVFHHRLCWILRTCLERGLPPGRTDVFKALAQESLLEIHPDTLSA